MDQELVQISELERALAAADDPPAIIQIEAKLDAIERYMRDAGLYDTSQIRPVNEARMLARWKLGRALAKIDRAQTIGPGRGHKGKTIPGKSESFLKLLRDWKLKWDAAQEAQRVGTLPEPELRRSFARAREQDVLTTLTTLIEIARPYWYAASRKHKHQQIAANAIAQTLPSGMGPFPLLYADPPWKFEIYSEKGLERTPDQHYETLTDAQIVAFKIGKRSIKAIVAKDAALLLWCTSSNIHRALKIMAQWDFTYKAHAVWVKDKSGLGLVFRNKHEVLLYGTRGKMPGPQYQPPSVFEFPRGRHSAKPKEIQAEIERMYPDFDARTRLELFARDESDKHWTRVGFEARGDHVA